MTRQEILELLKRLRAAYPNSKIADPVGLVEAWEMAFGEDNAEQIYKAARHHLETSPFFPTIVDIRHAIVKGELLYGKSSQSPKIANLGANIIEHDEGFCPLCGLCDVKDQTKCPIDF
jgi:hypothetical protein